MFLRALGFALVSAAATTFACVGCNGPAPSTDDHSHDDHGHEGHDHSDHKDGDADHKDDHASTTHDHSGWWCAEHGVPEAECGQCQPKVADTLKKKGDWCEDHNRPDSQCFACHPELQAKFAARYEAKYGKAPPKMN
jgi:hypothetical protein